MIFTNSEQAREKNTIFDHFNIFGLKSRVLMGHFFFFFSEKSREKLEHEKVGKSRARLKAYANSKYIW